MSVEVERVLITTTGGDVVVGAARQGQKARLLAIYLNGSAAYTLRWESAAGGTALSGVMSQLLGGPYLLPFAEAGWVEADPGDALSLEVVVTGTVAGHALVAWVPSAQSV